MPAARTIERAHQRMIESMARADDEKTATMMTPDAAGMVTRMAMNAAQNVRSMAAQFNLECGAGVKPGFRGERVAASGEREGVPCLLGSLGETISAKRSLDLSVRTSDQFQELLGGQTNVFQDLAQQIR